MEPAPADLAAGATAGAGAATGAAATGAATGATPPMQSQHNRIQCSVYLQ